MPNRFRKDTDDQADVFCPEYPPGLTARTGDYYSEKKEKGPVVRLWRYRSRKNFRNGSKRWIGHRKIRRKCCSRMVFLWRKSDIMWNFKPGLILPVDSPFGVCYNKSGRTAANSPPGLRRCLLGSTALFCYLVETIAKTLRMRRNQPEKAHKPVACKPYAGRCGQMRRVST